MSGSYRPAPTTATTGQPNASCPVTSRSPRHAGTPAGLGRRLRDDLDAAADGYASTLFEVRHPVEKVQCPTWTSMLLGVGRMAMLLALP